MATRDTTGTTGMKVVDNTDRFRAADADKKVFDPEHASGVVLLNGVIVVSPDERAPVGAIARSIGLVEYEVDEHPQALAEGGQVDEGDVKQPTGRAPDMPLGEKAPNMKAARVEEDDVKQPTGRAPEAAVDAVAAPKTGTTGPGKDADDAPKTSTSGAGKKS